MKSSSHARTIRMLAGAFLLVSAALSASQDAGSRLREDLRLRIETARDRNDDWILARSALPEFYEARSYEPAWVSDPMRLSLVDTLIARISSIRREGLEPGDYHLERLRSLMAVVRGTPRATPVPTALLVELELRATDAFLMLASHLVAGRTDPETLHSEWVAVRREANPIRRLNDALRTEDVGGVLDGLAPAYADYERLRDARARYERIASEGGWPTLDSGPKLEIGATDSRVPVLRTRLGVVGDLDVAGSDSAFDAPLREAVVRFQTRHGLDADGIVGPATLSALNVSARDRVRQIEVNMERWRWLPQDLGERYLLVNIPNFELNLFEGGEVTMSMRAVVGRSYRMTPVFSDRMTYLVLNPRWNVPYSIATQDILPKLKSDPDYLKNQNMRLFQGGGGDQRELTQGQVDWTQVSPRNFNYTIRQDPGPTNALGRVKFMFPNQFNVYLHDTPARELFSRTERTFSSGCIRLERPLDLAAYLLGRDRNWSRNDLDTALARGTEQSVSLNTAVPVHLLYWTAWVEPGGRLQFRNDIYSRDTPVRMALDEPAPRE